MTTAVLKPRTHPFDVEDIEYLRHGDKPLLARVFRPRGEGPFPALIECHGGAWCLSDRTTERLRHQAVEPGLSPYVINARFLARATSLSGMMDFMQNDANTRAEATYPMTSNAGAYPPKSQLRPRS